MQELVGASVGGEKGGVGMVELGQKLLVETKAVELERGRDRAINNRAQPR
jgi:hypothetical protein